ncbi:TRAP transporter large permease [Pseudomonas syringae pv. actinidiae]|uniref:TRAP transporter large permease n=1 Tax=Pseudomonas syringae TaxID=317 RepID=UPI000BB53F4E|nr:TRAP transporter large permease [Pseudomonas syringae]PBK48172.1 C4-dicarboxylate ABC transporter permease [Pseudomonas syringae pv. actinidiae]PBK48739.1 C4-dicarboxylate ABC transporter permease [Pseudomonas syringae pv. actinidiae]RJX48453.1 TRAP transporter large permease [Pseudomonas syringae pv. actinidiae]RJX56512.1 TRAP transporter large permease [Pseudomonas syringae pv. actinidiae]RJX57968.1 TRAP transporter large permease [Pseudomonas syringae pv. actinidiae]
MTVMILFLAFFCLLMAGLPVVWAMAGGSIAALLWGDLHLPLAWLAQQTLRGADSSTLASIPLFLLAGELMNRGGLTLRIMRVAEHCFGRLRGGLGLVNVATAFVYGGLTGSATADTGTVAKVMIPVMEARGYPRAFAAAVTAASGTLGIIVPPSVILIMFGVLTNTSIGGPFMAGVIPGLMLAAVFMLTAYIVGVREGFPKVEGRMDWALFLRDTGGALPALLMPFMVLGSIVTGFATATEAASLSVLYALAVGTVIYRQLSWRDLFPAVTEAVTTTGSVMIIMAVAMPFGWILTFELVPHTVATWIVGLHTGPLVTILLVILVLKVVGFWLDLGPAMIILAPILVPVAKAAGFEPYQIGLIFTMTLGWGLFTPPIGTNIFVVCNVGRIDIGAVSRRLIPFWIATAFAIALLVFFPNLTQWLPRVMGY